MKRIKATRNNSLVFSYASRRQPRSNDGLTLIECLVAISVIALTSALIAPVAVLSVATRVQNQKAEQSLQLAQGEIDRVKLLVERMATYTDSDLKLPEAASAPLGTEIATSVGAPQVLVLQSEWTDDTTPYLPTDPRSAKEIDTNADGDPDFVVQSFRGEAVEVSLGLGLGNMPVAFDMGVRVYDYAAITDSNGDIDSALEIDPSGLSFTSGEGQRGRRPLAALYTQVINSDEALSLCAYMDFLEEVPPVTMNCN